MPRRFGRFAALVTTLLILPLLSTHAVVAKVDPGACSIETATSVVTGTVRNVKGDPVQNVLVEVRQPNKDGAVNADRRTRTNGAGIYILCVPHDTYDVRASDDLGGLYATANKQVSTFLDPSGSVDFALQYKLNLKTTPQSVSIPSPGNSVPTTWTVRSKAPCVSYPSNCTDIQLTLQHLGSGVLHMIYAGTELGGPGAGGWNVWTLQFTLANPLSEAAYEAEAKGFGLNNAGFVTQLSELAVEFYFVDNRKPVFGPSLETADPNTCNAGGLSPSTTTNPWALITVGVCDPKSNGGSSSLDPYTVQVEVWDPSNMPVTGGGVTLNQLTVQYLPAAAMSLGTYTFRYTMKDGAGNQRVSSFYTVIVTNSGGSVPTISGVQPANLGEGCPPSTGLCGIVVGSANTTPLSRPVVAFQARDADGQLDLSYGSLKVRIYGPDGKTLLYDYDASLPPCFTTASCPANSGFFNQGTGRFDASGFSLVAKPPGLYVATASITDRGGNATTRTWRWILVAAA